MNNEQRTRTRDGLIGGVVLILVGTLFLIQQVFAVDVWQYAWPLALIAIGVGILLRRSLPSAGPRVEASGAVSDRA